MALILDLTSEIIEDSFSNLLMNTGMPKDQAYAWPISAGATSQILRLASQRLRAGTDHLPLSLANLFLVILKKKKN